MQSILREKLLNQVIKLVDVGNFYGRDNTKFVDSYFKWLDEAQADLSSIRSPISATLQTEKTLLNSISDGYIPENIQNGKSVRKTLRAAVALSIERITKEITLKIENIDSNFSQLNEKLCHAIAVLASKFTNTYNDINVSQKSIDLLWKMLSETPETIPMYNYFCAKLSIADRNYLITDLIENITKNHIPNGHKSHH